MLRDFDKWLSPAQKVHPVFLYGNHDNYRGTLFGLPAQFKDTGLVAQHGHQADDFNADSNAKIGYLLTQAAFAVLAVRLLEDPMSALVAGIKGGIGPRLTFTEMALEEAVFKPILAGKKPAMTFVMGHTHEPVLQEIRVLEYIPANPPDSPPPPAAPPPSAAQHDKVQVSVRFLQVDTLHVGSEIWSKNWHMSATVRQINGASAGAVQRDLALFGARGLHKDETIPLPGGQTVELEVGTDCDLQISCCGTVENVDPGNFQRWSHDSNLLCFGQKSDAHGGQLPTDCAYTCIAAVNVRALTWGGTKTIEGVSKALGLKVTFELLWGKIVG
jgi:predicted phosphodiesterase